MLLLKYVLLIASLGMFVISASWLGLDLYGIINYRRKLAQAAPETEGAPRPSAPPLRWRKYGGIFAVGLLPLLLSLSIDVVPSGMAGVRVSQISGTLPGTLYPGVHFVKPFIEHLATYDTRDHVFTASSTSPVSKKGETPLKSDVLKVQAREGLDIGLSIAVRYRLDPRRLDYIHSSLPHPVDEELVPPIVVSAFREVAPNYTVRDIFAVKREEVRQRAAEIITKKLGADGIIVKEVMLRDIQLPPEYAKGLEDLLLKEQQNDQLSVETEIHQKQVKIAEYDADAEKVAEVKRAEGAAQVRVLQAKSESDAMQYTLPLKQKQIEQTRLESQARKEATIQNAEANAQAKVIDSKAEMERRKLLAGAEAERIRVTAAADAERMKSEAAVLKSNPLLINKIIAERLSDKVQIMMVPTDGKFFFNDVLRSMPASSNGGGGMSSEQMEDPPERAGGR
ncbi:MAG TPA: SPFH domain-containing protein [Terriglobales bacterium]|nr:SPFH domain-containing protein [Terriglobales bacterium]